MRGLAQLRKLRLSWFLLSHGLGSAHDFVDVLYRIYLNHSKIIHFRDGFPVYSLSTPALFSRPAHHFIARTLYRGIQNRNIPNLMSLAVTDGCNARCSHCSFYEGVEEPGRPLLSLEQTRDLIRQAQELGVSIINLVGGEPLQRPDLSEIIRSVNKDLSTVLLFTNGWHLAEQAVALRRAGLDSVYVSLDAADAARHDQRRGLPGLFDQALEGLRAARRQGLSVVISATRFVTGWPGRDCCTAISMRRGRAPSVGWKPCRSEHRRRRAKALCADRKITGSKTSAKSSAKTVGSPTGFTAAMAFSTI